MATPSFKQIEKYLGSLGHPYRISITDLRGFLYGVVCAPDLIPPSEWIPAAFQVESLDLDNLADADGFLSELMILYNECAALRMFLSADLVDSEGNILDPDVSRNDLLPPGLSFRPKALDNFADDAPAHQWAFGFMRSHLWLEDSWFEQYGNEQQDMYLTFAAPLLFFASEDAAKELAGGDDGPATSAELAAIAERVVQSDFLFALMGLAELSKEPMPPDEESLPDRDEGRAALTAYLNKFGKRRGLTLAEVQGFIFGVTWAPTLQNPADWVLTAIGLADDRPPESGADLAGVLSGLLALSDDVSEDVILAPHPLPDGVAFMDDILDNFGPSASIRRWCTGFARSQAFLDADGIGELSGTQTAKLVATRFVLSFFSSRSAADAAARRMKHPGGLAGLAEDIRRGFADAMTDYVEFGM